MPVLISVEEIPAHLKALPISNHALFHMYYIVELTNFVLNDLVYPMCFFYQMSVKPKTAGFWTNLLVIIGPGCEAFGFTLAYWVFFIAHMPG